MFRGNIMALSSITVNNNVTVHGRALARNAAVTLDDDVFLSPTCAGTTGGGGDDRHDHPARRDHRDHRARRRDDLRHHTRRREHHRSDDSGHRHGNGYGNRYGHKSHLGSGRSRSLRSAAHRGAPLHRGTRLGFALLFLTLLGAGTAGALLRRRTPGQSLVEHASH